MVSCAESSSPRRRIRPANWLAAGLLALLTAACAPPPVRIDTARAEALQAERERSVLAETDWGFSGRVALSARGQGGSGRIEWRQSGEDFDLRLTAPVTGQSWNLSRRSGQVRLEGLEGGVREGRDAEALLLEATGWRIPVDSMRHWVRGARTDGPSRMEFDATGHPALLEQGGWAVEFRDWGRGQPPRPGRLYARQSEATVRLIIDAWTGR
ncbi:lipoprotein insertase outer membrane protein LolB [Arenimonas sp.]|uniref:lipoprotein insertase outer membrane protein LolB n=1 Tax=Arenimonas sp. TaxID=1872635 RepID=UPI0039E2AD44